MQPNKDSSPHSIIFGEVLFDCIESGETLGGAPFNVAWHLRGFGHAPLLVTRIGRDERGKRVLAAMDSWGLATAGIQIDEQLPTGRVDVQIEDGEPSFDIRAAQAYDAIEAGSARAAAERHRGGLLYHGSLALREAPSRKALMALRTALRIPVFMDVNLRAPWWDREQVREDMGRARWVKLNDGELRDLARGDGAPEARARALRDATACDLLIVTRGERGAFAVDAHHGVTEADASRHGSLVDTVGAGDAFAAVSILGLLEGWSPEQTLARAARFAGRVCGLRGAVGCDREAYHRERNTWES